MNILIRIDNLISGIDELVAESTKNVADVDHDHHFLVPNRLPAPTSNAVTITLDNDDFIILGSDESTNCYAYNGTTNKYTKINVTNDSNNNNNNSFPNILDGDDCLQCSIINISSDDIENRLLQNENNVLFDFISKNNRNSKSNKDNNNNIFYFLLFGDCCDNRRENTCKGCYFYFLKYNRNTNRLHFTNMFSKFAMSDNLKNFPRYNVGARIQLLKDSQSLSVLFIGGFYRDKNHFLTYNLLTNELHQYDDKLFNGGDDLVHIEQLYKNNQIVKNNFVVWDGKSCYQMIYNNNDKKNSNDDNDDDCRFKFKRLPFINLKKPFVDWQCDSHVLIRMIDNAFILAIGGVKDNSDTDEYSQIDDIYMFDMNKMKWFELDIKLPNKISGTKSILQCEKNGLERIIVHIIGGNKWFDNQRQRTRQIIPCDNDWRMICGLSWNARNKIWNIMKSNKYLIQEIWIIVFDFIDDGLIVPFTHCKPYNL